MSKDNSSESFISHFFRKPSKDVAVKGSRLTTLLVPEFDGEGRSVMTSKVLELMPNPLSALNFDDFSLSKLLKLGVSYKSIQISPDFRVGLDSEVDSFNERLSDIASSLFNSNE